MSNGKQGDGWIAFATILAAMAGVTNALFGFGWLFFKEAFPERELLYLGAEQWGWVLVIFGALQVIAAFTLIARKNWGRIFTIIIAAVSFIAWISWVGSMPLAGVTALVLDILVIYGLSVTREQFS